MISLQDGLSCDFSNPNFVKNTCHRGYIHIFFFSMCNEMMMFYMNIIQERLITVSALFIILCNVWYMNFQVTFQCKTLLQYLQLLGFSSLCVLKHLPEDTFMWKEYSNMCIDVPSSLCVYKCTRRSLLFEKLNSQWLDWYMSTINCLMWRQQIVITNDI